MKAAMLIDLTRCTGCEACTWACKEINNLPREDGAKTFAANTYTHIDRVGDVSVRKQCMHCEEPACASVCPVGALVKTAEGPVTYDEDKCIGCRYCMIGCPFDVPKYEWSSQVPRVRKCIMCAEKRVTKGEQPACAEVCPTGATKFGDRTALLEEAHRRIAENPDRYVAHVYGEREAGGTSVFYLSAVPFEKLGFKTKIQTESYPQLTWRVLSKLPNVVSVAGVSLVGLWWIIKRRDTLAEKHREAVLAARRELERERSGEGGSRS